MTRSDMHDRRAAGREGPILFSAPMIKALLAGTKTMTRRIVKLRELEPSTTRGYDWSFRDKRALWNEVSTTRLLQMCPHGVVGDRLWVKETFSPNDPPSGFIYRADGGHLYDREPVKWKPAIFCSRYASRITLEITDVRVERLQDITEDDAKAEGAAWRIAPGGDLAGAFDGLHDDIGYRAHFRDLWQSINGEESWDANPWVWCIAFRKLDAARSAA